MQNFNNLLQLCFEIVDQHLGNVIFFTNNDFKIKLKSHVACFVKTTSTPFVQIYLHFPFHTILLSTKSLK